LEREAQRTARAAAGIHVTRAHQRTHFLGWEIHQLRDFLDGVADLRQRIAIVQDLAHEIKATQITRSMASKYFGDKSPLGETLMLQRKYTFTVTGIVEDFPSNSAPKPIYSEAQMDNG